VTGNVSATGSLTVGGGSPIVESVSVTASVTLPAIGKSSCGTLTMGPVTGFTPGATDTIALGIPGPLANPGGGVSLVYQSWETTTTVSPTITVQACNPTGTDYAGGGTGTIRADVFKH
jgi:hypothetical protein